MIAVVLNLKDLQGIRYLLPRLARNAQFGG
jgi:hypothetical protein